MHGPQKYKLLILEYLQTNINSKIQNYANKLRNNN